jgi:sugar-specific transcriptional regulator TrmB
MPEESKKQRYYALHKEILKEQEKFKEKIERIQKKIEILQKKCRHKKSTYHGDPSGGSDSFYECDDCKKESKNEF